MSDFLTDEEEETVVAAIREAERRTTGEIRVLISSKWIFGINRYAWKSFRRLGMSETDARNGALIVVFERRHRFAVIGDRGLNEVVDEDFWRQIADQMSESLKNGRRCEAIAGGINALADTMARHWPADGENPNELPDHIAYD